MSYLKKIYKSSLKGCAKLALPFFYSAGVIAALTACSVSAPQGPQPVFQNTDETKNLFTLDLLEGDTQASLEKEYDAEVLVWKPEAGFAILGSSLERDLLPQSLKVDVNKNSIELPFSALASGGWVAGESGGWAAGESGGWAAGESGGWASGESGGWASGDNNGWIEGANGWALGVNNIYLAKNETAWKQIDLFAAHATSSTLGYGVKVAIIDTGIDLNHTMFAESLAPQAEWRDYVDYDFIPQDEMGGYGSGHGTAVAGIILQVAPQAKILPIRVLNQDGFGNMDHVIYAIDHAIQSGANIINLSLGTDINSSTLAAMSSYAKSRGVYLVAAAGNTALDDALLYPAKLAGLEEYKGSLFAVGSVNTNDAISIFSTARKQGIIFAPGEGVRTAFPNDRLASVTGTSFAAPIFAGSLALAYSELATTAKKEDMQSYVISGLERQRLESKFYSSGANWRHGNGILDANAFINSTKLANLSFETSSSWLRNWTYYNGRVSQYFNSMFYRRNGKQFALINKRGYIRQEITQLKPNTTYEVKILVGFDSYRGQGTFGLSNFASNYITVNERFTALGRTNRLSYVTTTFTTGSTNTNAILEIKNEGKQGNMYIDELRLKAVPN